MNYRTAPNQRLYRKMYEHRRHNGVPTSLVPADSTRNHIIRLGDLGWSTCALGELSGISHQGIRLIITRGQPTVERRTRALILAVPYTLNVSERVSDESYVPAAGAVRRVRALMALGWTRDDINARTRPARADHIASDRYDRITAQKWRAVDTAYRELHMTPGPSTINRARAIKLGYAPPLAYEDIDAPDARPAMYRYRNPDAIDEVRVQRILGGGWSEATPDERAEVLRRWLELGRSLASLERQMGWNITREKARAQEVWGGAA